MNQDWLDWTIELGLFVVADGMGGHNAGEVAAHLAIEAIREFVQQSSGSTDLTWPFPYEPARSIDENRLLAAVRVANRRIYDAGCTHDAFEGMGTTVVAVLVDGSDAALISVGDSRIYRWRDDALDLLTTDDTWLSAVLGVEEAERSAATHPMRHVLTSVVGTRDDVHPSTRRETLRPGDRFVLCSDGVHGRLDAAEMSDALRQGGSAEEQAGRLVERALARRTTDNATALVLAVD